MANLAGGLRIISPLRSGGKPLRAQCPQLPDPGLRNVLTPHADRGRADAKQFRKCPDGTGLLDCVLFFHVAYFAASWLNAATFVLSRINEMTPPRKKRPVPHPVAHATPKNCACVRFACFLRAAKKCAPIDLDPHNPSPRSGIKIILLSPLNFGQNYSHAPNFLGSLKGN